MGDHPFHQEPEGIIFNTPEDQQRADKEKRDAELHEFNRAQVDSNKSIARFTKWLAFATFLTLLASVWQGTISEKSSIATAVAVDLQEIQMRQNRLNDARSQWMQSEALKQSSKSLQATIDQFHLDQRAWVGPIDVDPAPFLEGTEHVYLKTGEKPRFSFEISNSGKTPALQLTTRLATQVYKSSERFLPDFNKPTTPSTVAVLFPGAKLRVETSESHGVVAPEHVSALTSGDFVFYVYGEILYDDVFGAHHKTTFCTFVQKSLTKLTSCSTYNHSD
jgi:hypothetical protein